MKTRMDMQEITNCVIENSYEDCWISKKGGGWGNRFLCCA